MNPSGNELTPPFPGDLPIEGFFHAYIADEQHCSHFQFIALEAQLGKHLAGLAGHAREFLAGLIVALSALLCAAVPVFSGLILFRYLMLSAALVFFLQTIVYSARQVFLAEPVNLNKIVGAVCIFLHFDRFVYFSLVTLTTLGYADIAPATPLAGILATLEAVVGVFYIAILVAALVGDFMATRKTHN